MTNAVPYKDYLIEPVETSSTRWRAPVRRLGGQKIKTFEGGEFAFIPTGGIETFSIDDAVAVAKEMIDRDRLH